MKLYLKLIYSLSKAIWLLCIAIFSSLLTQLPGSIDTLGITGIQWVFVAVSLVLAIIHFLTCFRPLPPLYDWSLVASELPPLKKNFFTKDKTRKLIFLVREISSILIYLSVMIYFVFPHTGLSILLVFGLATKAIFYVLNSFLPYQPPQDVSLVFKELKSI
jgi:hypothetical protein